MTSPAPSARRISIGLAAVIGLAVGGAAGIAIGGHWDSGWVEAVGTWFGGFATVIAILWAVRVFRHEQQLQRVEGQERRDAAVAELEREAGRQAQAVRDETERQVREATAVILEARGGGGFGSEPDVTMDSINIRVINPTVKMLSNVRTWVVGSEPPAEANHSIGRSIAPNGATYRLSERGRQLAGRRG